MLLCKGEGASGEITTGWLTCSSSPSGFEVLVLTTFLISLAHMPFVICRVNSQAEAMTIG
jgi:hypothetical protein